MFCVWRNWIFQIWKCFSENIKKHAMYYCIAFDMLKYKASNVKFSLSNLNSFAFWTHSQKKVFTLFTRRLYKLKSRNVYYSDYLKKIKLELEWEWDQGFCEACSYRVVVHRTDSPGQKALPSQGPAVALDSAAPRPWNSQRRRSDGRDEVWSYIFLDLTEDRCAAF